MIAVLCIIIIDCEFSLYTFCVLRLNVVCMTEDALGIKAGVFQSVEFVIYWLKIYEDEASIMGKSGAFYT